MVQILRTVSALASLASNHDACGVLQKNSLKAAADKEMKAAVQRISGAGPSSTSETDQGAVAPLKTRLQQAVENMQEGLVERDTEVRAAP